MPAGSLPRGTAFGAFDLGTTNVKAALLTSDGTYQDLGAVPNTVHVGAGGAAVCKASETLTAFTVLLERLGRACESRQVRTLHIGLCGHVSSLILWDTERGDLVCDDYPIWMDTTSRPAVPALRDFFADGRDLELLGSCLPVVANWLAVMMRHHLERPVPRSWRLLQVHDYIYSLLTGRFETHFSGQVSLVDYRRLDYADEVLSFLGVERVHLPTIVADSTAAPLDTCGALALRSLPVDTRVRPGLADRSAGFCGMALRDGDGILLASTSDNAGIYLETEDMPPECVMRVRHEDGWIHYGSTAAGGSTLRWFLERFADGTSLDALSERAAEVPVGSEGLVFLPYLTGERAPLWNERASASFVGLRAHHRTEHLFRAVLEGIACGKRALFDTLGGARPRRIKVAGGGARNDLQNRIRASLLGIELEVHADAEFPLRGLLRRLLRSEQVDADVVLPPLHPRRVLPEEDWRAPCDALYARFQRVQKVQETLWGSLSGEASP